MLGKILFLVSILIAVMAVIFLYQKAVNFDKIYPRPLDTVQSEKLIDY